MELGSEVQDTITGFTGILTATADYITGCTQVQVTPRVDKEGKLEKPEWFDEPTIKVLSGPTSSPLAGTAVG